MYWNVEQYWYIYLLLMTSVVYKLLHVYNYKQNMTIEFILYTAASINRQ